jgi:hypothetical protein
MNQNDALVLKAKKYVSKKKSVVSAAEKKLALAWLNEEITLTQASHALGKKAGSGSVYLTLMRAVKSMWGTEIKPVKKTS